MIRWLNYQARFLGRRLLRRGKYVLGHEPALLPIYLRATPLGTSRQITEYTDLVIEGFPRCGNTFTAFAIEDASRHELAIVSHVHQPSQIKLALARGKPTVFIIRDPISALASYLAFDPRFPASTVIGEYSSYHRELVPYAERLLICEFEDVTSNISSVIERINNRFSLGIRSFDESPSNVKRIWAQIEQRHRVIHPKLDPVKSVASPQLDRRRIIERKKEELLHPSNATRLAKAQEMFDYFRSVAARQARWLAREGGTSGCYEQQSRPAPIASIGDGD